VDIRAAVQVAGEWLGRSAWRESVGEV